MRNGNLITWIAAIFVTVTQASDVLAGDWVEFPVHAVMYDQHQQAPDIYRNVVVWEQFVDTDFDIYGADITDSLNPFVFVIDDDVDYQLAPSIYENTVVWQSYVETDWDVWAVDISDQAAPQYYPVSEYVDINEIAPAVHGNIVIWQDDYLGDWDILGADITDPNNPAEFFIATYDYNQCAPALYRNTVVWHDDFLGDWDLFAAGKGTNPLSFPFRLFHTTRENRPSMVIQSSGRTTSLATGIFTPLISPSLTVLLSLRLLLIFPGK
ncbi:hypothetical protein ES707_18176 [subsurface metagenome]